MDKPSREILCCQCGETIGEIITIDGLPLLRSGNQADRSRHGVCLVCGRSYSWTTSDKMLERLVTKSVIAPEVVRAQYLQ